MQGFKISPFWQAVLVVIAAYLIVTNAFPPVTPVTLVVQYMVITILGVLLYYSHDDERWAEFMRPILAVLREERLVLVRWGFLIAVPAIVGYTVYGMVKPSLDAPVELRQVHPAPPSTLKVYNKSYDLATLENPKRMEVLEKLKSEPEAAREQYTAVVNAGREVYYQNCFYCHGDLLDGNGHYGHGFNPRPANFQDVGTIAQLQEAFLFWRITTGGPGLPKEGTPWKSAMPVWHEMLDEDQVWDVITFLYDYVGQVPRIWDPEISKVVTGMKDELKSARAKMTGMALYRHRCLVCHGETGMGDGPAADFLYPRPRDFTLALFKYKSSPPQQLPRDEDLFNTIKKGLPGTSMPGWASLLSDEQIRSLIPVVKGFDFTAAWAPDEAEDEAFDEDGLYTKGDHRVITENEPQEGMIPYTEESVAKGREAFLKACKECHGAEGRGNIISGKQLADDWGGRLWPRDLTKPWTWRATNVAGEGEQVREQTIRNIYARLSIGIPGTPMPAHRAVEEGNEDPVSLEDRWHIANFVYSLRETSTPPSDSGVIGGVRVDGALPQSVDDPRWNEVAGITLSLVPNIIKEPRLFRPLNDAVTVKVLYNSSDIAFLLELHDRTKSLPGDKYFTELMDESLEMHSDAVAIQFPKDDAFETAPVVVKPLYRHGDAAHPTTIWYWNAGSVEPEAAPRAALLDASGPNVKLEPRMKDKSLSATGEWHHGRWQVLMTRPRDGGEGGDVVFDEGRFIPISFANWDGSNGEVGARHTLTTWYWLLLPPDEDPSRIYGIPGGIALLIFVLGLLLVRGQRRQ